MRDVHLRPATPEDAGFVYAASETTLRPLVESVGRRWSAEPMRAKCRDDVARGSLRIIQVGGEPAGYFAFERRAGEIWLDALVLLPGFQRLGIGSRLLADVVGQSAATDLPVRLAVFSANPARQFWEHHGFTTFKQADHHCYMERRP